MAVAGQRVGEEAAQLIWAQVPHKLKRCVNGKIESQDSTVAARSQLETWVSILLNIEWSTLLNYNKMVLIITKNQMMRWKTLALQRVEDSHRYTDSTRIFLTLSAAFKCFLATGKLFWMQAASTCTRCTRTRCRPKMSTDPSSPESDVSRSMKWCMKTSLKEHVNPLLINTNERTCPAWHCPIFWQGQGFYPGCGSAIYQQRDSFASWTLPLWSLSSKPEILALLWAPAAASASPLGWKSDLTRGGPTPASNSEIRHFPI